MNREEPFGARISPRFHHFQDEEIVSLHQGSIEQFALEIGVAFSDQRSLHQGCGQGREVEGLEFVNSTAGDVAASHDFFGKLDRGNVDDAFPGLIEGLKRVIAIADDAADQWRLKLHHRMP